MRRVCLYLKKNEFLSAHALVLNGKALTKLLYNFNTKNHSDVILGSVWVLQRTCQ